MSKDAEFLQTEGINYLRWTDGPEYYEGAENVAAIIELTGQEQLRDLGCGYGRLAKNFLPSNYVGYDICASAIRKAVRLNPGYSFVHWDLTPARPAKTTLFANGPHLVSDDDIAGMLDLMCQDTQAVVISELMGREHRNISYIYGVYHRAIEEYDEMFLTRGFVRTRTHIGEHLRLHRPYTVARWEHV